MEQELLLKKVAEDVSFIKNELVEIKADLDDLRDLEVRPEYLEKLEKIEKGKFHSREEVERILGE
ncbi:hypothetical protein COV18_07230 [Candidatus Woesearchaeota archaeon CG10_big_fil_rev_8_21_14_0_10_37_12]|nr:MAG: hypothetical protein COV18_07230 [Candidatus Woesearchaeota archaeon CG10_big_fil_rev_8_21_14_0_10_37_12]